MLIKIALDRHKKNFLTAFGTFFAIENHVISILFYFKCFQFEVSTLDLNNKEKNGKSQNDILW